MSGNPITPLLCLKSPIVREFVTDLTFIRGRSVFSCVSLNETPSLVDGSLDVRVEARDLNCGKTSWLQISSSDDICQTLAVRDEWYHQSMRVHTFNEEIQVVLHKKGN